MIVLLMLALLQEMEGFVIEPLPAFQDKIQALAFPDIENLEPAVREQLKTLRDDLAGLIVAEPKDLEAIRNDYMKLGRTFHAYKRYQMAEICYQNSNVLSGNRFETIYLMADLARLKGEGEKASRLYRKAIDILPTYHASYVRLGDIVLAKGNTEEAKTLYEEALRREPIEAAAYFGLGQVAMQNREFDTAITHFEKALEYVGEADRIHYLLGTAWRNKGDLEKAKFHLKQAGKRGVKPMDQLAGNLKNFVESGRVHIARGNAAFGAKDYLGAAKEYMQAAAALPNETSPRVNLGTTLALLGKSQEAAEAFKDVLRIDPNNIQANYNLGMMAQKAGNPDTAIAHFQVVVKKDPKDGGARLALADLLRAKGQRKEAFEHYDMAAKMEPENEDALVKRAYLLIQSGQNQRAMQLLTQDCEQNPTMGRLVHLYARFLAACPDKSLRNGTKAVALAERVAAASPTAEHLETLAMAYAQNGNCEKAQAIQTKAVQAAKAANRADQTKRMEADLALYSKGSPCEPR